MMNEHGSMVQMRHGRGGQDLRSAPRRLRLNLGDVDVPGMSRSLGARWAQRAAGNHPKRGGEKIKTNRLSAQAEAGLGTTGGGARRSIRPECNGRSTDHSSTPFYTTCIWQTGVSIVFIFPSWRSSRSLLGHILFGCIWSTAWGWRLP